MIARPKSNLFILVAAILAVILCSGELQARRGGGGNRSGRSFSRSGFARSGSMSGRTRPQTRPAAKPQPRNRKATNGSQQNRQKLQDRKSNTRDQPDHKYSQEDRQEWREDNREDRQQAIKDRQEDRQDFIEDELDDHYYHNHWYGNPVAVGVVVGTTAAAAAPPPATYVTTLPCKTVAIVANGISYYNCGDTWYQRSYAGSQITYMVTSPPPGH